MNIHNSQNFMRQNISQYLDTTEDGMTDFGELGHIYFLFIESDEAFVIDRALVVIYDILSFI